MAKQRSEQELVRIEKLDQLRAEGYPYPNDVSIDSTSKAVPPLVDAEEELDAEKRTSVTLAGRMMTVRLMGKAAFCHIQDRDGRVQLYVRRDEVGDDAFAAFKKFDLGDIVEVSGIGFRTKTGEPSIRATSIRLLTKCLHPLPEKWHGLTDVEIRYRQRYLDLFVNPDAKEAFITRSKVISRIRRFFDERDYLEVETPLMGSLASGAAAKPFITHHNTLDMKLFMRIAPELYLKRLVVGGMERVYELGRVFRNEGISTHHNPEFTMLEFYEAYATYESLMDLTEELVVAICDDVVGSRKITFGDKEIDFSPPWKRISMEDAVREIGGVSADFDLSTLEGVQAAASDRGLEHIAEISDYGKALSELYEETSEEQIINPTFITRFPTSVSPFSRPRPEEPDFVDRFELICCGMELANAFSELNDPVDQHARFEAQLEAKRSGEEEVADMDEDYVRALEYGLPPTAGEGIGIDRLVMILTGMTSIRDVILFPLMRPHDSDA